MEYFSKVNIHTKTQDLTQCPKFVDDHKNQERSILLKDT